MNKEQYDRATVDRDVVNKVLARICPTPTAHAWRNIHGIIKCPKCGAVAIAEMAEWQHGYRTHGLWIGLQRIACISIGPLGIWKRGINPYSWSIDGTAMNGEAMTLKTAKKAVINSLSL